MKINYNRLRELNLESFTPVTPTENRIAGNGNEVHSSTKIETLPCFYVVQNIVERLVNGEEITPMATTLLIDLGVLVPSDTNPTTEDRRNIVQPFNFMGDGTQSS
jgi:hypothetical protein